MFNFHKTVFLSNTELVLPDLISRDRILSDEALDDYYLLKFQTKKPFTMDKVMDMFENDAQLHILYHHIRYDNGNRIESCCAFSHPIEEQMYKYYVCTDTAGKVTEIFVNIHYSLDNYAEALADDLRRRKDSSGRFEVAMEPAEIYRIALLSHR